MTALLLIVRRSVEVAEDLATNVLLTGLFVVHDTLVSSQNESAELTGWEDGDAEVLEVLELEIEVWGDDSALVESSVEVNADLSTSGIIDDLEVMDRRPIKHVCPCSREHFARKMVSLGEIELEKLTQEEEEVRVQCQFCRVEHVFDREQLNALLYGARLYFSDPEE